LGNKKTKKACKTEFFREINFFLVGKGGGGGGAGIKASLFSINVTSDEMHYDE